MNILGIDPGAKGSLCYIGEVEVHWLQIEKATERDIYNWLMFMYEAAEDIHAFIEKVGPNRGQGERRQGASSMFTFGQGYGLLRGLLIASGIPFEEVQPVKWQSEFSLKRTAKDESTTDKKNRHKAKAQQLFPAELITHWKADALLIAEYGRRLKARNQ